MSRETCVRFYTTGTATVAVHFPNGLTVCQWCPYLQYREGLKRHQCALTGEYLPYPFDSRGNECPILLKEEDAPWESQS